jgi:outer membrane immunogenic protein
VGAGTEVRLSDNWSAKFEYLYIDLGNVSIDTRDIDGAPFHVGYRARDHILRVGLNYRFDERVIAKY